MSYETDNLECENQISRWIFVCGMKRSGSTLQYQIIHRLLEISGLGKAVDWTPETEFDTTRHAREGCKFLLYKCHAFVPVIEQEFQENNAIGFYSYRDPRDACASWQRKTESSFLELWLSSHVEDGFMDYQRFMAQPNMNLSRYEDFHCNIAAEANRIAKTLQIDVSQDTFLEISNELSLENQRQKIEQIASGNRTTFEHGPQIIDRDSLLHSNHITSSGDSTWSDFYTPLEQRMLTLRMRRWIHTLGYTTKTSSLSIKDHMRCYWRHYLYLRRKVK